MKIRQKENMQNEIAKIRKEDQDLTRKIFQGLYKSLHVGREDILGNGEKRIIRPFVREN